MFYEKISPHIQNPVKQINFYENSQRLKAVYTKANYGKSFILDVWLGSEYAYVFSTHKKDLHIAASLGQPVDPSALGWNKLEFVKM